MAYLLPHLLEKAAQISSDQTALVLRKQQMTYGDLHSCARGLSLFLMERGARAGDRIGILNNKSVESFIALWGIMDMGGVYVPIDPGSPPQRVEYVIRDCGIKHLVTEHQMGPLIVELEGRGINLETLIGTGSDLPFPSFDWAEIGGSNEARPAQGNVTELDLAYIIYTSGSTGVPKGIAHTHRSGVWFAEAAVNNYRLSESDVMSNYGGIHYDFATLDAFAGAMARASLLMFPEESMMLPGSFAGLVESSRLTFLYTVPLALVQLAQPGVLDGRDMSALPIIAFGGEVMPIKHLRKLMRLLPSTRFVNVYGPAETNGCTEYWIERIPEAGEQSVPIGRPFPNVKYLITDDSGTELQAGAVGELMVNSPTMMKGYWGGAELNKDVFHVRTSAGGLSETFVRTGDLVHRDAVGLLHFHGRRDRQIKSRGFRIELDEVEAVLNDHPEVQESAAFGVKVDEAIEVHSAVLTGSSSLTQRSLYEHAAAFLSRHALPRSIQIRESFPRTTSGKIDRRALRDQLAEGVDP